MIPEYHHRKHPARQPVHDDGNLSAIIFLTVCAKDRKPLFTGPEVHELLLSVWSQADHWRIGRYMIMPDHIHLFCSPGKNPVTALGGWVKYWKALASRHWPRPDDQPVWQQHGWDTQLRAGQSYTDKWNYVRLNPVRAGLAEHPDKWPYQGEMNILRWHDR